MKKVTKNFAKFSDFSLNMGNLNDLTVKGAEVKGGDGGSGGENPYT